MIADILAILGYIIVIAFCLLALAWGVGMLDERDRTKPKHRRQRRPIRAMFLERDDQPTEAETERIVQAVAAEAIKGES